MKLVCLHGEARTRNPDTLTYQARARSCTVHYVRLFACLGLELTGAQFNCVQHGALSVVTN